MKSLGKEVSIGKGNVKNGSQNAPQLVAVLPKELCQEMGQAFDAFIALNGTPNEQGMMPGVKGKIAKKMIYNKRSIHLNAEKYGEVEVAYIKENVEHDENGERIFWNGVDIEDKYEETPIVVDGLPAPEVDRKVVGGLFAQKPSDDPMGYGYFNKKGEQLPYDKYKTMALYVKDEEKRIPFAEGMKKLMGTPVEVSLYLFSDEELNDLKLPVFDAGSLEKFYNNYVTPEND